MNRLEILDRLNKAANRAAVFAVERGSIKPMSKKQNVSENAFVEKSKNGFYNVLNSDEDVLYRDISMKAVAEVIAQYCSVNETKSLNRILFLESHFFKHHTDMIHYLNCIKLAKTRNDRERMYILEDKFQIAEIQARELRDEIASFKRVK
jgi:hypothetical protein